MTDQVEKTIVIKVSQAGVSEFAESLTKIATASDNIGNKIGSLSKQIGSLMTSISSVPNIKGFTSSLRSLILLSGKVGNVGGLKSLAKAIKPLAIAMNTLSGATFDATRFSNNIQTLTLLGNADMSGLAILGSTIQNFGKQLASIPIIDTANIKNMTLSVSSLRNMVDKLPTDYTNLQAMSTSLQTFVTSLGALNVSNIDMSSLITQLNSISRFAVKDLSTLSSSAEYIRDFVNKLASLSVVAIDFGLISTQITTLKTSLTGLSGLSVGLDKVVVSIQNAVIGLAGISGAKVINIPINPSTLTGLAQLSSKLSFILSLIREINTVPIQIKGLTALTDQMGVLSSSVATMRANLATLNTKLNTTGTSTKRVSTAMASTSVAVHSTNRALHFFRTALTTIGFTIFMKLIRETIDEFIELRSRVLLTAESLEAYTESLEGMFRISNEVRASIGSMSKLFNKFHISLKPFGATIAQSTALVKALGQSIKISGSNTAEQRAFYVQFGQAIQSGLLRGREFRSMLESNLYMSRLLAKELAGGSLGKLRQLAFSGQLSTLTVTNAILKNQKKINKDFSRVGVTISDMFILIKNELVSVMMEWDKTLNQSKAFIGTLEFIRDNIKQVITGVGVFVGTTMIQLLIQFKLLSKLTKGLGAGLLVFGIRKMYKESKLFRDSLSNAVTYIDDLINGSTSLSIIWEALRGHVRDFIGFFKDFNADLFFLTIEEQLVKVMALLDAIWRLDFSKSALGLSFSDVISYFTGTEMQSGGVFGFLTGNVNDDNIAEFEKSLKKYKKLRTDFLIKGQSDWSPGLEFNLLSEGSLAKFGNINLDLKNFFSKNAYQDLSDFAEELQGINVTIDILEKKLNRVGTLRGFEDTKAVFKDIGTYLKDATGATALFENEIKNLKSKKLSLQIEFGKTDIEENVLESMDEMATVVREMESTLYDKDVTLNSEMWQKYQKIFREHTGTLNAIKQSLSKNYELTDINEEIESSRKNLLSIESLPDIESTIDVNMRFGEISEEYKLKRKALTEEIKDTKKKVEEELAEQIKIDPLESGLFLKYFDALLAKTDITWTPDLKIKPKGMVMTDIMELGSFKKELESISVDIDGLSLVEQGDLTQYQAYIDKLFKLNKLTADFAALYSKTGIIPLKEKAKLDKLTSGVKAFESTLNGLGETANTPITKLKDLKEQLRGFIALTTEEDMSDFLKTFISKANEANVSIEAMADNLKNMFSDENIFKSLEQFVATGGKFDILTDFYGKVSKIGEISKREMASIIKDNKKMLDLAGDDAEKAIIAIHNLRAFIEEQKLTEGDRFGKGVLEGFKELYKEYSDIIGQINGLTVQIFDDFALEASKYFLGLEEDWKGFLQNMLKSISETTFKMLLYGENGILAKIATALDYEGFTKLKIADVAKEGADVAKEAVPAIMDAAAVGSTDVAIIGLGATAGFTSSALALVTGASYSLALALSAATASAGAKAGMDIVGSAGTLLSLAVPTGTGQTGGNADKGNPIWVGETGRELFIPDQKGHIYNNANSESKNKKMAEGSQNVTIMNYTDKNQYLSALNSPKGRRAIINTIGKEMNRNSGRG